VLKQRVITALVLLLIGIGFLFVLPPEWVDLLIVGVLGLMAWEWAGLTGWTSPLERAIYAWLTVLLFGYSLVFLPDLTQSLSWQIATLSLTTLTVVAVLRFAQHGYWPDGWQRWVRLFGLFWLVNFSLVFSVVFQRHGVWLLLFALSLVWITDTGAYFSGRRFGRHKLAVKVSPGKTWEGVYGGVGLAVIFAVMVALNTDLSMIALVAIASVVAFLSVFGDLFESALKRQMGVKDSSQMLPGHGGWLDRFDALLLALPLFWLLWQWTL
jgi:phosphatidate cytidylyltransferase